MKRLVLASIVFLIAISVATAAGPVRHDSILFLTDVSWTVTNAGQVPAERSILKGMSDKFPAYVQSAGLLAFGKYATDGSDWLLPVAAYDREAFSRAADSLKPKMGSTPLGRALRVSDQGLKNSVGKTALVILSDGEDNGAEDPVGVVKGLKKKYGDNLCVFTIQVGASAKGAALLEQLVKAGGCGKSVKASDLTSAENLQGLVDFIFPTEAGPAAPPPPPPPPPAEPKVGDADGDGVLDDADQCPGTPAGVKVDSRGCWVLKNINFDTNSAAIKAQYYGDLDEVVAVLQANPGLNLIIQGHTDSQGNDDANQKLSQARAESVMKYLANKGIDAGRLSAEGFGETQPIASNDTVEGRAENRRIELKVK